MRPARPTVLALPRRARAGRCSPCTGVTKVVDQRLFSQSANARVAGADRVDEGKTLPEPLVEQRQLRYDRMQRLQRYATSISGRMRPDGRQRVLSEFLHQRRSGPGGWDAARLAAPYRRKQVLDAVHEKLFGGGFGYSTSAPVIQPGVAQVVYCPMRRRDAHSEPVGDLLRRSDVRFPGEEEQQDDVLAFEHGRRLAPHFVFRNMKWNPRMLCFSGLARIFAGAADGSTRSLMSPAASADPDTASPDPPPPTPSAQDGRARPRPRR